MKELFIASNNRHKIDEIRDILSRNGVEARISTPADFDCKEEPVEDGKTFAENAFIKADFYHSLFHLPTLADDSGICIDYLKGYPGIHSARFLSDMDYDCKNDFILQMMKDVKNRRACFIDCICYIDENEEVHYYEGINQGAIATEKAGSDGFGYDPIFLIPEYQKTEAELGMAYKNEHSHRAKALKEWVRDAII